MLEALGIGQGQWSLRQDGGPRAAAAEKRGAGRREEARAEPRSPLGGRRGWTPGAQQESESKLEARAGRTRVDSRAVGRATGRAQGAGGRGTGRARDGARCRSHRPGWGDAEVTAPGAVTRLGDELASDRPLVRTRRGTAAGPKTTSEQLRCAQFAGARKRLRELGNVPAGRAHAAASGSHRARPRDGGTRRRPDPAQGRRGRSREQRRAVLRASLSPCSTRPEGGTASVKRTEPRVWK